MTRSIAVWIVSSVIVAGPVRAAHAELADDGGRERARERSHVVERGQTLLQIARGYGCQVAQLKRANRLTSDLIRAGQKLAVPSCHAGDRAEPRRGRGDVPLAGGLIRTHVVERGDTLGAIAREYDTTVSDIRRRNGLDGDRITAGQKLRIAVGADGSGRPIAGQSVGSPHRGRLVAGVQLPRAEGYYRRRPARAWGASHTVFHVRSAVRAVRRELPAVHDLAIGDISARRGGKISQHVSHQSGRDVDVGLYYSKRPDGYPASFVTGTRSNLHLHAMWLLLDALARTADQPGGVYMMFLDYDLQGLLYRWAARRGVSRERLGAMFQYPRGKRVSRGLIRHESGHDDHLHVRFQCPPDDRGCH